MHSESRDWLGVVMWSSCWRTDQTRSHGRRVRVPASARPAEERERTSNLCLIYFACDALADPCGFGGRVVADGSMGRWVERPRLGKSIPCCDRLETLDRCRVVMRFRKSAIPLPHRSGCHARRRRRETVNRNSEEKNIVSIESCHTHTRLCVNAVTDLVLQIFR